MSEEFSLGNLWLLGNVVICVGILSWCYRTKNPVQFWSPPLFIAAIYVYYVIVGPWITFEVGSGIDRGVDMRAYCGRAWLGSLVALVAWLAGYAICGLARGVRSPVPVAQVDLFRLWRLGIGLNAVGFCCFAIVAGGDLFRLLNPFVRVDEPTGSGYSGLFFNYFALAVNFLIPGCAILFMARLKGYGRWPTVLFWSVVACGIYVTLGFRYRLVLLGGAVVFVFYLHRRTRPNLLLAVLVATIFVILMGEIGATRRYGLGLDLRERNTSWKESLLSGFGEASIFGTSGAVLAHVPEDRAFVGFEPIKQALLMPLPSQFYRAKNSNGYMVETLAMIYGEQNYLGAAYMSFAETYLAFGWVGLIVAHFFLGWICRWLWLWYFWRQHDPLALLVYAASVPYLYVIFSRGYLPQAVMLAFFSVAPAVVLYLWSRKGAWRGGPGPGLTPARAGRSRQVPMRANFPP